MNGLNSGENPYTAEDIDIKDLGLVLIYATCSIRSLAGRSVPKNVLYHVSPDILTR